MVPATDRENQFGGIGHSMRKKQDEWRFYVDYRELNKKLVVISYPLPMIGDIPTYLNGS